MPETSVDYFGFTRVGQKTPLLVRAPEEKRETLRERHGRDGVIFTEARDMPSLEALLEAHEVGYTVLQLPPPFADDEVVAAPSHSDWRTDASTRLAAAVEDASNGDALFHENYAFIPALREEDLDHFLAQAHAMFGNDDTTEGDWQQLLFEAEQLVAGQDPPVLAALEDEPPVPNEIHPLLTTDDLRLTKGVGAIGGPPPLVHSY